MVGMNGWTTTAMPIAVMLVLVATTGARGVAQEWPFEVTDLRDRETLTILVFGDAGTGNAGQHRVGRAMFDVCRVRRCDFAVMLGDNIYENGIEVDSRADDKASFREIVAQVRRQVCEAIRVVRCSARLPFLGSPRESRLPAERVGSDGHVLGVQRSVAATCAALRDPPTAGLDSDARDAHGHGRTSRPERLASRVHPSKDVPRRPSGPLEAAVRSSSGLPTAGITGTTVRSGAPGRWWSSR